jgi:myb proto-oncogene protein
MGIDPVTHTPRLDLLDISSILSSSIYNSSHHHHHHHQQHMNMSRLMMSDGNHQPLVNPEILKLATSLFSNQNHPNNTHENNTVNQTEVNQYQTGYNMPGNEELQSWFPIIDQFTNFQDLMPMKTTVQNSLSYDDDCSKSNFVLEPYYSDFASVLTTPSSSPTPLNSSSSTYINSSTCSTEDEKESYYSDNITNYSFDVNGFLQFQ